MSDKLVAVVADLHTGGAILYGRFPLAEAVSGIRQSTAVEHKKGDIFENRLMECEHADGQCWVR